MLEAPDISDASTASLVGHEWVRRLSKVRTRYTYTTYDTTVLNLPIACHVLLTDKEIGIHNESMCYEGCSIDQRRGIVTIQLLSIDGK